MFSNKKIRVNSIMPILVTTNLSLPAWRNSTSILKILYLFKKKKLKEIYTANTLSNLLVKSNIFYS